MESDLSRIKMQVNEMKFMLMAVIAPLTKERKEDKPEDSKRDEDRSVSDIFAVVK